MLPFENLFSVKYKTLSLYIEDTSKATTRASSTRMKIVSESKSQ